jgi:outer membrane immunogenic protein
MRIVQLLGAIALLGAGHAMAWDCHVGVFGGGISGTSQQTDTQFGFDLTGSFDVTGGMGGGAAGCRWPLWGGALGFEVDYAGSNAHGSVQELPPNYGFFAETNVSRIATVRAVVGGNTTPKWFIFITGGLAAARTEAKVCNPINQCAADSHRLEGIAGSLGAEYAFTQNLRLKLEYMAIAFEKKAFTPGPFLQRDVDLGLQMIRAGLNLHF